LDQHGNGWQDYGDFKIIEEHINDKLIKEGNEITVLCIDYQASDFSSGFNSHRRYYI
jgi:hypothetical protein